MEDDASLLALALAAEIADRDWDEGIDAGRQVEGQPAKEDQDEGQKEAPVLEGAGLFSRRGRTRSS